LTEPVDPRAARRVLVGRIAGVYGVKGWVRIESWTEPRTRIFRYQPWWLRAGSGETKIDGAEGREQGKGLVACLPGIDDREQAASLIGCDIEVPRSALPAPRAGEVYWADLEGCEVVTVDGVALGRISHLVETGANDVLVVRDGARERLIPYVRDEYVTEVDLDAGRVTVDWDPEF
jgi:16S rRNA processing protein RimM